MGIEIRTNTPKPTQADIQAEMRKAVESVILQKHQERLAYNAAYQRDLRTIKRLGLSVTVSQYRKSKET